MTTPTMTDVVIQMGAKINHLLDWQRRACPFLLEASEVVQTLEEEREISALLDEAEDDPKKMTGEEVTP